MKTSYKGFTIIKDHEGLKLTAYKCPAGVWTIGYGHTKGVKKGDTCTKDEADAWLIEDVKTAETALTALTLNQNQFDALVSFTYNLGTGNLKKSTLYKKAKLNPNDESIRDEFAKWINSNGKPLAGLIKRRAAESELYYR